MDLALQKYTAKSTEVRARGDTFVHKVERLGPI